MKRFTQIPGLALGCLLLIAILAACNSAAAGPTQPETALQPTVVVNYEGTPSSAPGDPASVGQPGLAAFTRLNLNTASGDEFQAIPAMSSRMVREFNEYRPYTSILQFRREIGKYVSQEQVAAYEQYVYVPVDVNNSDLETLMQIPGLGEAQAQQLIDARPFDSNEAFMAALGEFLSEAQLATAGNYLAPR